jgi:hypothetical protein
MTQLPQASVKEEKTRGCSGGFVSCEIVKMLQYSGGRGLLFSFVPNALVQFHSYVSIPFLCFGFLHFSYKIPLIQTGVRVVKILSTLVKISTTSGVGLHHMMNVVGSSPTYSAH